MFYICHSTRNIWHSTLIHVVCNCIRWWLIHWLGRKDINIIVLIYFLGYLIGTSVHVTKSGILNCIDTGASLGTASSIVLTPPYIYLCTIILILYPNLQKSSYPSRCMLRLLRVESLWLAGSIERKSSGLAD